MDRADFDRAMAGIEAGKDGGPFESFVAAVTGLLAERFGVSFEEAAVPVGEAAAGHLRGPVGVGRQSAAVMRFAEDLGGRVADRFVAAVDPATASGSEVEAARLERDDAAGVVYELCDLARGAYLTPEPEAEPAWRDAPVGVREWVIP
jgi:hypothetical protein